MPGLKTTFGQPMIIFWPFLCGMPNGPFEFYTSLESSQRKHVIFGKKYSN